MGLPHLWREKMRELNVLSSSPWWGHQGAQFHRQNTHSRAACGTLRLGGGSHLHVYLS